MRAYRVIGPTMTATASVWGYS